MSADPLAIARDLLRCPSVTPAEGGALAYLETVLKHAGFEVHRMTFTEPGTEPVENFYARIGKSTPHLMFAGHTDVVPSGPVAAWSSDPFIPTIRDGRLYGRGAADMKSSLAAFVVAVEYFVSAQPQHPGSIALLLTSDEEGPATDGTVRVVERLQASGTVLDYCIVGEPSSVNRPSPP